MRRRNQSERMHPPYFYFKMWMAENKVSLEAIAKILGTTPAVINLKNNGYMDYSLEELNKLADYLDLDLNIFKPRRIVSCSTFCSTNIFKLEKRV